MECLVALVEVDAPDDLVFVAVVGDAVLVLSARVARNRDVLHQVQRLRIELRDGEILLSGKRRPERDRRRSAGARKNRGEVAGQHLRGRARC